MAAAKHGTSGKGSRLQGGVTEQISKCSVVSCCAYLNPHSNCFAFKVLLPEETLHGFVNLLSV